MRDVILFFAYALGKLLSELRFLGWKDDKIGRFAGGLSAQLHQGEGRLQNGVVFVSFRWPCGTPGTTRKE
jgi:hypothetical protein